MMVNPINRLTANNAAYSWMSSANSLMSFNGGNGASLLSNENLLRTNMLNDSLTYKASLLMDETNKKLVNDDIKRTFSIFA